MRCIGDLVTRTWRVAGVASKITHILISTSQVTDTVLAKSPTCSSSLHRSSFSHHCFLNHSHSHRHFSSHHTVLAKSPTCSSSLHRSSHSHHCFQNYSHSHRHFSSHPHTHQHFTVINNKPSCPHKSHATTTVQFLAFFQFELQCAKFKRACMAWKGEVYKQVTAFELCSTPTPPALPRI